MERGTVFWGPSPFKTKGNPRPWLNISTDRLPYAPEERIGVALSTQSHHRGSIPVPEETWKRGNPDQRSHVLPWVVATMKLDHHVQGIQGSVQEEFVDAVVSKTVSYLQR